MLIILALRVPFFTILPTVNFHRLVSNQVLKSIENYEYLDSGKILTTNFSHSFSRRWNWCGNCSRQETTHLTDQRFKKDACS